MIAKQRKLHRAVWLFLAVALPILLAAAIFLRHDEPKNKSVPKRTTTLETK